MWMGGRLAGARLVIAKGFRTRAARAAASRTCLKILWQSDPGFGAQRSGPGAKGPRAFDPHASGGGRRKCDSASRHDVRLCRASQTDRAKARSLDRKEGG